MKILQILFVLLIFTNTLCAEQTVTQQKQTSKKIPKELLQRQDDKRPDDQYTIDLFGRPLVIGGEYEATLTHEEDYTLDKRERDDLLNFNNELQLELFYMLSNKIFAFAETKVEINDDLYAEDDKEKSETALDRGELWFYFSRLFESNLSLQLGRQNYQSIREWWWDDDLDAIRLHYNLEYLHGEISIAEEIDRVSTREDIDPNEKDITRILSQINWQWNENHYLGIYYLYHDDHSSTPEIGRIFDEDESDDVDSKLTWFGFDTRGKLKTENLGKIYYWSNLAFVRGQDSVVDFDDLSSELIIVNKIKRQNVRGWGIDLGATFRTKLPLSPNLTVAYATTSKDNNLETGTDRTFRQTGLQDNNYKFRGVDRFRYYGELLRPELSNLRIFTAAVGIPILNNSSIELIYHNYRQVAKADFLREIDIDADPNGRKKDIGDELDLIFGVKEWKHVELEFISSIFKPGNAFDSSNNDPAHKFEFKFSYNF